MEDKGLKKTILVVDDNKELVSILKAYLERHEFDVITAYDGTAAVRLIKSVKPSLVILDVGMPKKGGFEVCREMTTKFGHLKIPVMVITGHNELKDTFEDLEIDGFLSKPFELEEMVKEVKRILEIAQNPNVILVDPNPNCHGEKIISALGAESYKTALVTDLNNFKQLSMASTPKFVLVEYIRGDMSGCDFIRELKKFIQERWGAQQAGPAPMIVAYSYSGLDYTEKSLAAGADRYLEHPEDYSQFVRTLRELEISSHEKQKDSHRKAA